MPGGIEEGQKKRIGGQQAKIVSIDQANADRQMLNSSFSIMVFRHLHRLAPSLRVCCYAGNVHDMEHEWFAQDLQDQYMLLHPKREDSIFCAGNTTSRFLHFTAPSPHRSTCSVLMC